MKKYFLALIVFALLFVGCEQPTNNNKEPDDENVTSTSTTLTITNQSSYDLLKVTYSTIEFGDLAVGKEATKDVSADSKPIYFYLKILDNDVHCKTNDLITCEEDEAAEQAITNNTTVTMVDSGQSGTLRDVYESVSAKLPLITVTQNSATINPSGEYDFGSILQNTTQEITFTITNSGGANLTFVNNSGGNRIYLEDNTASVFKVVTQPLSSTVVAPGGMTTFTIRFNPVEVGTYLSTVVINTNSHENALFDFRVKGTGSKVYQIGDTGPAGGIVFYDKGVSTDGWRYLEAAPAATEFTAEWGTYGYSVTGLQEGIGAGETNTTAIVYSLNTIGESGRAAQLCDTMVSGGYSDWFLPSKSELALMYTDLKAKGLGNFKSDDYWSSSQHTYTMAWFQNFGDGKQYNYPAKDTIQVVRAVRAF